VSLRERSRLLERLTRIQRSISHRAPLQEVLDAITTGGADLLGDSLCGLRLIDPEDPRFLVLSSACGVRDEMLPALHRGPVGEGAGGRAISEDRLVVIEAYDRSDDGLRAFRADHLQTAMAAPVRDGQHVVGSLTVASYASGRRYSEVEQAALLALAEHASLALTDARTVAAMREAQQAKDLFLAMVSHELKTPLTVIMGTLRTLERHRDRIAPERQADMLAAAYRRGRDLERLIDSLLRGARAELATSVATVPLPDLVAESLAGFHHLSRLELGDIPDAVVTVDTAAVRAVLGGLLENAVAHAPEDSPIELATAVVGGTASLVVRNPGTLPPEMSPEELFRPFQRGPAARSSGVGLGLHIARRHAESLGGTLTAEQEGDRVGFTLRFPLSPPPVDREQA
ncbi:MAG: GAF domain-containing sensor histidine kinase, partial [Euzebyales bacterium]|nr:GAF domain-containing sensor histidine kinase [Euzebyales bacterium]